MPKPYLTYLIILVNVIVFQQENQWGGTENLQTLHALGALTTEDVLKGEWWRLVMANFLHHVGFHLGVNMLCLYYIGSIIESYLGRIRYLLIYFSSGCLSMLLMVFYFLKIGEPQTLLVGASAAIMGLIGAMGAIFLQDWWQEKSSLARQRFMFVLLVVGIQFLIDYNTPHVSLISHVFGLIIGFMVGLILIRETT